MSYPRTYRFSEEVDTQLLDGDAMIRRGYLAVAASTIIGAAAIYAIGIGPLLPVSGNRVRSGSTISISKGSARVEGQADSHVP